LKGKRGRGAVKYIKRCPLSNISPPLILREAKLSNQRYGQISKKEDLKAEYNYFVDSKTKDSIQPTLSKLCELIKVYRDGL
jgi:hypothetical protein